MNKIIVVLFLVFGFTAKAGHEIGNGGDIVVCSKWASNYSLDYIFNKNLFGKDVEPAKVKTLNESFSRILKNLQMKVPKLSQSFSEFIQHITNTTDFSKPYVWEEKRFGIPKLDTWIDQSDSIPAACGTYEIKQAVIREDHSLSNLPDDRRIVFTYDYMVMNSLSVTQLSFIYVHEWLWNFSNDVVVNRKVNFLIHSTLFDSLTASEVQQQLQDLGFIVK